MSVSLSRSSKLFHAKPVWLSYMWALAFLVFIVFIALPARAQELSPNQRKVDTQKQGAHLAALSSAAEASPTPPPKL